MIRGGRFSPGLAARALALLLCLILGQAHAAQAQSRLLDGVPMPDDARIAAPDAQGFAGVWAGAWANRLRTLLVVEDIRPDGSASVIYAYGDAPDWGIRKGFHRYKGEIEGDLLTVFGFGYRVTYLKRPNGRLIASFRSGDSISLAVMTRAEPEALSGKTTLPWQIGQSGLYATELQEDGAPVHLEIVTVTPDGPGPFPLAVISHGSTGRGRNPEVAKRTAFDPGVAAFLVERGYMVAFPQRRGRGRSEGLYDEGFRKNRAKGYSCDTATSLRGADRAVEDLGAALAVLKARADVADAPVLLGGISRGGILSLAYAGRYPEGIAGVVNFVGGWMGEACPNASAINGTLFGQAATFGGETLWLYGKHDRFYSLDHIGKGYETFRKLGGKGSFHSYAVEGGNGHGLSADWNKWAADLGGYLDGLPH